MRTGWKQPERNYGEKACAVCKKKFKATNSHHAFCSKECNIAFTKWKMVS